MDKYLFIYAGNTLNSEGIMHNQVQNLTFLLKSTLASHTLQIQLKCIIKSTLDIHQLYFKGHETSIFCDVILISNYFVMSSLCHLFMHTTNLWISSILNC